MLPPENQQYFADALQQMCALHLDDFFPLLYPHYGCLLATASPQLSIIRAVNQISLFDRVVRLFQGFRCSSLSHNLQIENEYCKS